MERRLKILLLVIWSIIAIFLAGLIVFLISGGSAYAGPSGFPIIHLRDNIPLTQSYYQTFPSADINKISVSCSTAQIELKQSQADEIKVTVRSANNDKAKSSTSIASENGTLSISQSEIRHLFLFNLYSQIVEIEIPASYNKDIDFSTATGDIIFLGDYKFNTAILKSSVGDFTASSVTAQNFNYSGSVGDLNIGSLFAPDYTLNLSTGDIKIDSLTGGGKIESKIGDIKIGFSSLTGATSIHASTGDVHLRLPQSINAQFSAQTSLGNIDSDYPLAYAERNTQAQGQMGSGPYQNLTVSSSIGDIELKAN